MKTLPTPTALEQHWVHSHEEDTDTENVYRPSTYNFPPSRGRKSFVLNPDGTLIRHGIGPTDKVEKTGGTWKLIDDTTLAFFEKPSAKPMLTMRISSVDKERLVVKKV
jgi:hypothetical protein